ncbi:DNA replication initiation factor cdc45 [Phlyctema vagabunda]|uniref:DNA replication initiation factor cdc45 n=1 Tax=Phlyctema vagabunda TaxID=108571 RepID=A0ABR4P9U6_9HELO
MGIPHLITYLRPYAVLEPLTARNIVIDGPGFCYHIYNICLNERSQARNPFEAAPSYAELGDTALEWLDALSESGAVVKKICFDGFLPPSKFDVRCDRLGVYTNKAIAYHQLHPGDVQYQTLAYPRRPRALFQSKPTVPNFTKLPAVPFLVPAVLEALLQSHKYAELTEVVPGEADLYCAKYLKEDGGIVLTGDSDLLVHDLGTKGAVAFFREIESRLDSNDQTLAAEVYHPTAILKRLSLTEPNGLQSLAFQIVMDQHASFPNVVKDAKSSKAIKKFSSEFQTFMGEYLPVKVVSHERLFTKFGTNLERTRAVLKALDPRISEFVLQFPYFAELTGKMPSKVTREAEEIHVFLPFLLDCPTRTNAWEPSTAVRQLAFSLVSIASDHRKTFTVFEHRKQQKGAKGKELQIPIYSDIPAACTAIIKLIDNLHEILPTLSETDAWTALAIYQEVEWASSYEKLSLCATLSSNGKLAIGSRTLSWDIVHFLAQLQGSYYSLRMLRQISSLVLAYMGPEVSPQYLQILNSKLKRLPELRLYPEMSQIKNVLQILQGGSYVKAAQDILGISEQNTVKSIDEKKKRKREQAEANSSSKSRARSNNPFDMLGDDW